MMIRHASRAARLLALFCLIVLLLTCQPAMAGQRVLLIRGLMDYLPGISMKRAPMVIQKDFALEAKVQGLPEIIFSHKKHTVWNGCEVCHPEIFIGIKKGTTKYSMIEIFDGKYCGVCHDKVAFPQMGCQRCHTKPVS